MSGGELAAVAEARSRTYWLLSELFVAPPDGARRDELARQLEGCEEGADPGWADLVVSLRHALVEASPGDLRREHTRLLAGLAPGHGPPPPYESVHRGEGTVMGEATSRVVRAYAEAGFEDIHPEAGPPDHIGVELRFMALVAIAERDAWRAGDRGRGRTLLARQGAFARDHLLAWVPDYCAVLREESRHAFYAAAGALTERVVIDDRALIDDLLART